MATLAYIGPVTKSAQLDKEIKKIPVASAPWGNVSGMRDASCARSWRDPAGSGGRAALLPQPLGEIVLCRNEPQLAASA